MRRVSSVTVPVGRLSVSRGTRHPPGEEVFCQPVVSLRAAALPHGLSDITRRLAQRACHSSGPRWLLCTARDTVTVALRLRHPWLWQSGAPPAGSFRRSLFRLRLPGFRAGPQLSAPPPCPPPCQCHRPGVPSFHGLGPPSCLGCTWPLHLRCVQF
ncbi:hypothetical protein HJG60_010746 [Phyllostomus discolor]|uniref:Uncharacterized protein n=1 Tax=Phyllostomus discolor TaxID=89673 RepID=A0A834AGX5_9CHIR|nr:hypothetical protein HJG60_010746 [Phyllostomus discolor]